MSNEAHFERRRGTAQQAREYTRKEETRKAGTHPIERGTWTPPQPGKRTDLQNACDTLKETGSLKRVAEEHPATYAKYGRGLRELRLITGQRQREKPEVILLVGDTGTGKSFWCWDRYPQLFRKPSEGLWFDGYDFEETVLLDEFDGARSKMPLVFLLQLLDRYPFLVPIKGGHIDFVPKTILITSNFHPRHWYDFHDRQKQYPALARRITKVLRCSIQPAANEEGRQYVQEEVDHDTYFDGYE